MKTRNLLSIIALSACAANGLAEEPAGYYSSCEGRSGASLLSQLCTVVGPHTTVSYSGLWTLYKTSDVRANGSIWDMYSTKEWRYATDQCGSYSGVGSCYNREHSMPKSWFNDASPMVSDAFHIYPTDGAVNGQRSNYPYGECANGTRLPSSGSVQALGRRGNSTFPGYTGTVFEPDDEYKGDFARSYFYMAAAYNDRISGWSSDMLARNSYPVFTSWAIDLLLKWHRQDPVSSKELARNEVVYQNQNNRNPFIDHPELAEYIWGDKKTESWYSTSTSEPSFLLPTEGASLALPATVPGVATSTTLTVQTSNATSNISFICSGSGFSVSPTWLSADKANAADGAQLTVTYTPSTSYGTATGTLTLMCGSLTRTVSLSASVSSTLPAGPVVEVGETSFAAVWTYVGGEDANGCYTLDVIDDATGNAVEGYPRAVDAKAGRYLVEGLNPESDYWYTVSSTSLKSDIIAVSTLALQPAIEVYTEDSLDLFAAPGEASEACEIWLDVINIDSPVTVNIAEPFQLSTDKSTWRSSLTLDTDEDRVYLRFYPEKPGTYHASFIASAGEYLNDDLDFTGTCVSSTGFFEDFEAVQEGMGSYSPGVYHGTGADWTFTNAGMWPTQDTPHSGDQSVRMGNTATSTLEMNDDYAGGFGVVKIWAAQYNKDGAVTFMLETSTDGGRSWQSAGEATVSSTTWAEYTFAANISRPARLRIRQTAGKRFCIDDIEATTTTSVAAPAADPNHSWDAYSRDGLLIVERTDNAPELHVYALDGTEIALPARGNAALSLAPGLYIVAADGYSRRVIVH